MPPPRDKNAYTFYLPNELWNRILYFAFDELDEVHVYPHDSQHDGHDCRRAPTQSILPVQLLRVNNLWLQEGRRLLYSKRLNLYNIDMWFKFVKKLPSKARQQIVSISLYTYDRETTVIQEHTAAIIRDSLHLLPKCKEIRLIASPVISMSVSETVRCFHSLSATTLSLPSSKRVQMLDTSRYVEFHIRSEVELRVPLGHARLWSATLDNLDHRFRPKIVEDTKLMHPPLNMKLDISVERAGLPEDFWVAVDCLATT